MPTPYPPSLPATGSTLTGSVPSGGHPSGRLSSEGVEDPLRVRTTHVHDTDRDAPLERSGPADVKVMLWVHS